MYRIVFLPLAALCLAACTSRVQYPPVAYKSTPNAININTASVEELERLPGIGPNTAGSIITFRNDNGPFRRVENLMLVRGMSEGRFAEVRPYLRID